MSSAAVQTCCWPSDQVMGANTNRWKVSKMPADGGDNSVFAKPCPNPAQTVLKPCSNRAQTVLKPCSNRSGYRTLSRINRCEEPGRIGDVGLHASVYSSITTPYSHFVLNGVLLCEARWLPPPMQYLSLTPKKMCSGSHRPEIRVFPAGAGNSTMNAAIAAPTIAQQRRTMSRASSARNVFAGGGNIVDAPG